MSLPSPYLSDTEIVDEMRVATPGSLLRALADRPILVDVPAIGQVFDLSQDGGSMAVVLVEVDNLFSGVNSEREWGAFSRGHGICLVVASEHPSHPVGSRFSTPIEHLRAVRASSCASMREDGIDDITRDLDGWQVISTYDPDTHVLVETNEFYRRSSSGSTWWP